MSAKTNTFTTPKDDGDRVDAIDLFGGDEPQGFALRRWTAAAILVAAMALEIAWIAGTRDPMSAERAAVATLAPQEKAALAERWEQFRKLTPTEQQRLRDLHADIEADTDPQGLRNTLTAYQRWKAGLAPVQSASLVGLEAEARLNRVKELTAEQTLAADKTLSAEDSRAVMLWLERQVDQFQDKLFAAMPTEMRRRYESLDRRQRNWAVIMSLASQRNAGAPGGPRLESISVEALAELRDSLSPNARAAWDATKAPDERKQLLADWIRQSAFRLMSQRDGGPAARVDDDELRNFFERDLSDVERARYFALPREEMASQLRRDYLRRKGLWKEPGFGDGPFGRPPFGRGAGPPPERRPGGPGGRDDKRLPGEPRPFDAPPPPPPRGD